MPPKSSVTCCLLSGLKPLETIVQWETHGPGMWQWFKLPSNTPKSSRVARFYGVNCLSTLKDSNVPRLGTGPICWELRDTRLKPKILRVFWGLGFPSISSPAGIRKCKEATVKIKLSFFSESYLNFLNLTFHFHLGQRSKIVIPVLKAGSVILSN